MWCDEVIAARNTEDEKQLSQRYGDARQVVRYVSDEAWTT